MEKLQKLLGKRISNLRRNRGMTSEQLAMLCNMSKGYMSDIENGKRLPTLRALYRICKALKVPMREMF